MDKESLLGLKQTPEGVLLVVKAEEAGTNVRSLCSERLKTNIQHGMIPKVLCPDETCRGEAERDPTLSIFKNKTKQTTNFSCFL